MQYRLLSCATLRVLALGLALALTACSSQYVPPQVPQPSGAIVLSPQSTAANPMRVAHFGSATIKVAEAYYTGTFSVSGGLASCFSVAMQDATTVVVTPLKETPYGCGGEFSVSDTLGHSHTGYVDVASALQGL